MSYHKVGCNCSGCRESLPREHHPNKDVNFILTILGGMDVVRREDWMGRNMPKTSAMLGLRMAFVDGASVRRGNLAHGIEE